jgi:tetratricopeptide (TPR) repeat protein
MPLRPFPSSMPTLISGLLVTAVLLAPPAYAAGPATAVTPPRGTSAMDGELFFQLMLAEMELNRGEAGAAFQIVLEAAKRTRHEDLFKRAADIAVRARAGEQALVAVQAWRHAWPKSRQPVELQTQIVLALNKPGDAAEPLRTFIELTPAAERSAAIASVPRLLSRDAKRDATTAPVLLDVLKPWHSDPNTRVAALIASARIALAIDDADKALDDARTAQRADASSEGPPLVALEIMGKKPEAEALVKAYLGGKAKASVPFQLAYARRLTTAQRYGDALELVRKVTQSEPDAAEAWLLQGALQIEMADPKNAQTALLRFIDLRQNAKAAEPDKADAEDEDSDDEDSNNRMPQDLVQAYLMLAQTSEQQKDYTGAQAWLEKLGDAQGSPAVVQRRASLLARQGKLDEAMALLRKLPERSPEEVRAKAMGQAQVLRDAKDWKGAHAVLVSANERLDDDADLLYEQALLAEKLTSYDEMEGLLRRVIVLKPDQASAYNALGYSLADRGARLPEARELIARALSLAVDDPFITDSLGWVEFKLGRTDEALRLLRAAFKTRPDTEIAAHLGEVLWAAGKRDEAKAIWRNGRERDSGNDVLQETLARLKVDL